MIFIEAKHEPTMFLFLCEKDMDTLRTGRTLFVDETAGGLKLFSKVILGYGKTQEENLAMLRQHSPGFAAAEARQQGMVEPHPKEDRNEAECQGCRGIMAAHLLLEGRCISCWREEARWRKELLP